MKSRIAIVLVAALGAAVAARADERPSHSRMGFALHGMERCLASSNLSPETRAAAEAALASGRDALKADGAAMKAAHERMQTDIANGADKSVIGQDAVDADAARTKLRTDAQTARDQVLGALSADEQAAMSACMASNAGHWKRGHGEAPPPPAPNP